jgi:hypothetical protein
MKVFDILNPFFHALSDGKIIRLTVAWVLRILAVIMALIGLFAFIAIIGLGFRASENGMGTRSAGLLIGCVLLALFALAWGYLSAGILAFRARSVGDLGDSHFTVLSILSLLFRLNGELMFVTYSLLGVGGCLFVWFTDASPFSELGMLGDEIPFAAHAGTGFLGGIEMAVLFLLIAFISIVFCYALAELSVVLVEIALNTRGLQRAAVEVAAIPTPAPAPATPAAALPQSQPRIEPLSVPGSMVPKCRKCGQPLDAGSTFCAECGTPVE